MRHPRPPIAYTWLPPYWSPALVVQRLTQVMASLERCRRRAVKRQAWALGEAEFGITREAWRRARIVPVAPCASCGGRVPLHLFTSRGWGCPRCQPGQTLTHLLGDYLFGVAIGLTGMGMRMRRERLLERGAALARVATTAEQLVLLHAIARTVQWEPDHVRAYHGLGCVSRTSRLVDRPPPPWGPVAVRLLPHVVPVLCDHVLARGALLPRMAAALRTSI